jgi:serine/threonine protein kinase
MSDRPKAIETTAHGGGAGAMQVETAAFDASTLDKQSFDLSQGVENLPEHFGKYRIRKLLGRGGMGSVYLADDSHLDRQVALKIPRLVGDDTGKYVNRLMREAKAVASLRHANICPVFEIGEIDGIHYLAMAYIQGHPLSHYLLSSKPQTERAVAITVYKLAMALQEAHTHGILHRDLKPANIMVDQRGEPIVMDFGLSYKLQNEEARLTQDGTVIGTPSYMAPEQIDNRCPIGPATDVYALGVVLFELLTRRCPFQGSIVSVIGQVLHAPPPKLSDFRAGISPSLAAICDKAMSKDAALRYGSMKEFADALANFVRGKLQIATAEVITPLQELASLDALLNAPSFPATSTLPRQRAASWLAENGALAAGIGGVAIVVLLALFLYGMNVLRHWRSPTPAPTTTAGAPESTVTAPPAATSSPSTSTPTVATATPEETPTAVPATLVIEPNPAKTIPVNTELEKPNAAPEVQDPDDEPAPSPPDPQDNFSDSPDDRPLPEHEHFPLRQTPDPVEEVFQKADRNRDGRLDAGEVPLHILMRADKNNDNVVDRKELRKAHDRLKEKLFGPPSAAERRKLPRGPGGQPPGPPGPPPPN